MILFSYEIDFGEFIKNGILGVLGFGSNISLREGLYRQYLGPKSQKPPNPVFLGGFKSPKISLHA